MIMENYTFYYKIQPAYHLVPQIAFPHIGYIKSLVSVALN